MFDMELIGKTISNARKNKNMTQMELANNLSISFQAVSNWERGLAMPDVAKLPEISELLGLSIDEILGKTSPLIKSVTTEKLDSFLDSNSIASDELIEAAPLLKPVQVDKIVENCNPPFDLSQIEEIIPFISKDVCDALFNKCIASGDFNSAEEIAPFVSKNLINETIIECFSQNKNFGDLIVFASNELKDELAMKTYEEKGVFALDEYLPHISKSLLNEIANTEYKNSGLRNFEYIAPFMDKSNLNMLAQRAIEKDGIRAISPIAPFLDKNMLSQLIKDEYLRK